MARRGVARGLARELSLLQLRISRHAAVAVIARKLEHRVVEAVEAGQRYELELVAHRAELGLEARNGLRVEFGLPVEARAAIVGEQLAGELRVDRVGEGARVLEIRVAGLEPQQVSMGSEGEAAGDAMVEPGAVLQAEESLGRAFAGQERAVARVDVAGDQFGAFGVGPPVRSDCTRAGSDGNPAPNWHR